MSKKRNNTDFDYETERKQNTAMRKAREQHALEELLEYDDEEYEVYADMASDYLTRHGH